MKPQKPDVQRHWWTTCRCGKRSYPSRKAARRTYKNKHADGGLNAYECELNPGVWHYGHLQPGDRPEDPRPIGEAVVRAVDEAGVRRIEVLRADELILVSRAFLDGPLLPFVWVDDILTLDTAGEYRYRLLRAHDEHTLVFERITEEAVGA